MIDDTHDPALASWVDSANDPGTDFPLQNLPFGRFRGASNEPWRIGVAIGDCVLDLAAAGLIDSQDMAALLAQGASRRRALRRALSQGLRHGSAERSRFEAALRPLAQVELGLPCDIGDYSDFYAGIHHATAVGKLMRPDHPLLPNYKWVPIGYHGRASSIVPSGTPIRRPCGQIKPAEAPQPWLAATRRLDYELEMGIVIGPGNALGEPIPIAQAEDHIFGFVLLNDWSARDLQAWEYQPLGPFLAKSFATTISPWIVTLEALAPFRAPYERPAADPQPLPYLDSPHNRAHGALDITLEVWLRTPAMRVPQRLMRSNLRDLYWTVAQLVTHQTVNGCNLRPGDLLGTGTVSGPGEDQGGSLLELTAGGRRPLNLSNGETRTFLQDGDTVILRAYCVREGLRRIGFGECAGTILPAREV
ncbi:MAG: fumarylacetoacetase [Burkholderiaceae bacterium]|nr:fumarylacetoacetase [Burkholderiaceae bacterium]